MKVLFLDIDGVMNSQDRAIYLHNLYKQKLISEEDYDNWDMPYKDTLEALDYIVKNTGAKIVLSSTWRGSRERVQRLNKCFEPYGFQIYDKTCHYVDIVDVKRMGFSPYQVYDYSEMYVGKHCKSYTSDRGAEIAYWLDQHPGVESFVILDDDIADIKPYYTKEHIQTDFYKDALSMDCARRAVKILNE